MFFQETYTTVVISTSHISEEDSKQLGIIADEECSLVAGRDTGFFVKLYQEPEDNFREVFSDSLNDLLTEAARQGFRCIEFDRDADNLAGAKTFQW
ncbi:hypothetical protein LRP52_23970 [Photobacterium sp. ZSDE20]|uniref:DUF5983 domain-containing protein n=1 Tax=Photobacterium pectinilyticum TaxID=2906793 RepID=A0ABT1N0W9_9GAMM|nr:hypothetical protein [Photobacterium sp. ZSDE20]MCQ1058385.1 hypothetical protein [Photobacterium sp. ZSDE20]MDD1825252.1 hypothetical protein [Photobacterium sp. ZSDE20]